ncbi:hypothetical protein CHS0354_028524 [Potamilus streckersoni]|uniref:Flavin-containing monooxygenase n=1 Tax=Potamilus streckersoni TaxID=2493646 RepID=A0AAE0RN40_9BIVA|nr:hypothetical protein CHS0354_028524 [Potamilus streckersoni]
MKRIAIIGAGCSGLAAIKCCLDEGLEPVCFEREDDIGGLWNYSEIQKVGKGGVYKTCIINTSKEMMSFSDFPPPQEFPMFMPHRLVLKYFRMYADSFGLLQYINFKTSVENIIPASDYDSSGKWRVTFKSENGEIQTGLFDGVLVCTGHHTYPHQPKFEGLETFTGKYMHSHGYKENLEFTGKRVLVVGIGNSAVDIAVDLSHVAAQTYISTRRGAWIISRMGFWGLPADAIANCRFLFKLPISALEWCVEKMANFRFDHEAYGLQPMHRSLQAHPTINDELPYRIMTGAVKIRPDIHHIMKDKVYFTDGTFLEIDAIIFATGFDYKLSFVPECVTKVENNRTELYKYMFPPHLKHPTFALIGLVQAIGSVMPISEMQCRWFTKVIKGECHLPSEEIMIEDTQAKREDMEKMYVKSQRHTLQCFWVHYMDELADQIGVKPDLWKLLFEDPVLAIRCMFGPCVPAQYRLMGPGKWNGAKAAIKGSVQRCLFPTRTNILPKNARGKENNRSYTISIPHHLLTYFVILFSAILFCICIM